MNHASAYRRLLWLIIIVLGIGLRVGWCWVHGDELTDDRDGYIAHAQSVAHGEGFLGPYSHRPTAFRPPAYPIAIGLLQRTGCSAAAAVALLNGLSSLVVLVVPIWLLQRPTAESNDSDDRGFVLLLGTAFIAFDPLLIRYISLPMTEVPCAAVLLCAVTLFLRSLAEANSPANVSPRSIIVTGLAGLLFGLGALTRPIVLVACVAVAVIAALGQFLIRLPVEFPSAQKKAHRWNGIVLCFLLLLSCGVGMSPWIVRNQIQFDRVIFATTHGGYTLALGNNPDFYRDVIRGTDEFPWNGDALDRWQKRMIEQSLAEGVPADSEPASDVWYYQQAKAAIWQDSSAFVQACMLRFCRFWAVSTADESVPVAVRWTTSAWYSVVWVGLVINITALIKHRSDQPNRNKDNRWMQMLLWSIVAAFVAMHLVYWTDARMRAPVMPLLAILSATGWSVIGNQILARFGHRSRNNTLRAR